MSCLRRLLDSNPSISAAYSLKRSPVMAAHYPGRLYYDTVLPGHLRCNANNISRELASTGRREVGGASVARSTDDLRPKKS
ncbi:hypothetical protein Trydic_g23164 [Trypoxylus dichotomus]